jgi:hypothetical protein
MKLTLQPERYKFSREDGLNNLIFEHTSWTNGAFAHRMLMLRIGGACHSLPEPPLKKNEISLDSNNTPWYILNILMALQYNFSLMDQGGYLLPWSNFFLGPAF